MAALSSQCLAPGLLLAIAIGSSSIANGADQTMHAVEMHPEWLCHVQRQLTDREYRASSNDIGLQAPNRAHNLRTYFDGAGARVIDRTVEGSPELLQLRLAGVGRGRNLPAVDAAEVVCEGARVELRRPGLVEWYENSATGLEQGFTLEAEPGGDGPLTLELAMGPARAELAGDHVILTTPSGRRLRYGKLEVSDAARASLAARLEVPEPGRVRIVVDDAGATYPLTIDPLLTSSADAVFESNQVNAQLGYSVAGAGDVNGDGYSDVIVGAWTYDAGSTDEGAAFVYLGGPAGVASGNPGTAAATLESNQAGALLGTSVASAGDVNGDGYGDVIVGAIGYGGASEGAAFVFQGGPGGIANSNPATAATRLQSTQSFSLLGRSVAGAGDVNGDGYADVIVGANQYDAGSLNEGAAFVFMGGPAGVPNGGPATAAATIEPDEDGAALGWRVAGAGDVNGDGYADVIVGASEMGPTEDGAAFVFLGGPGGIIGGGPGAAATVLRSGQSSARLGISVAGAGDVNADGYADVIVGAYQYSNGASGEGAAFVFLGSAAGIPSGNATTAATRLESDQMGAWLGFSVAGAGDVNGDGYADVIAGAYRYDSGQSDEGAAFVFLGSASGVANGNPATAAATVQSDQSSAQMGWSVAAAGDVNGDGFADVIVGSPLLDLGEADEGAAFVLLGGAGGIVSGNPATAAATLESNQADALFGSSVASAGDVNGDGYADVIVGAWMYDAGSADEGAAFVFLGGPGGVASGNPATASATLESNQASASMGFSVASAGDVNGDGYADVIVGSRLYDAGTSDEGAAFVFLGGPGGIASGNPATAAATLKSNQMSALLGQSVAGAGDVNGDGYDDVIVGAHLYDKGSTDEGAAFVFLGSASGIASGNPATAAATLESNQANGRLGGSVAGAGDVNGDGYADVIVGSYQYDKGSTDEGAAFVFLGGPAGIANGNPATASATLESNQASAEFGVSVAGAGDVNGDGFADVIIGALGYDAGITDEGAAFVFLGGPAGIANGTPATASATLESNQQDSWMGNSVAGAGDVNGDGYADVIVGANQYSNGSLNEGVAFVFLGGLGGVASGGPATAAATLEPNQAAASLGFSVAGAGDVNGDGYADVIAGAYNYDSGALNEGAAFVFLGGGITGAGRSLAGGGTRGRQVLALQNRGDGSGRLVHPWGGSFIPDGFGRSITATDPRGRGRVKIETEACPPGTAFGNAACVRTISPTWVDVGASSAGVTIDENIAGLAPNTVYRWRARMLQAPFRVTRPGITAPPNPRHGPWRRLAAQSREADLRTGGGLLAVDDGTAPTPLAVQCFPNPTFGSILLSFTVSNGDRAKIALYDVGGRRVFERDLGSLGSGSHVLRLTTGDRLVPGVYMARLSQGRRIATTKVMVMQ